MKNFSRFYELILIAIVSVMLFTACDGEKSGESDGGDVEEALTLADIVIAEVTESEDQDSPVVFIAMTNDATEILGVASAPSTIRVFYISDLQDVFILEPGPDGLPASLTDSSGNTIIFENYTESTVDVSLFDADGILAEGPITVDVDPSDLLLIQELFSAATSTQNTRLFGFNPSKRNLKWASAAISVGFCIGAFVLTGPGGAILPCGAAAIKVFATATENEIDDIPITVFSGISCASNFFGPSVNPFDYISCAEVVTDLILFLPFPPEPTPMPTLMPPPPPTPEVCHDGIDNDRDGLVDCDDPDCPLFNCDEPTPEPTPVPSLEPSPMPTPIPSPEPTPPPPVPTPEICDDGIDNDLDGLVDCDDDDCSLFNCDEPPPLAYVVNRNSDDVSAINTVTDSVIHTEAVGINPSGIAVNPDGTEVYVSCLDTPDVFIIDTSTHTVIDTVPLPFGSRSQSVAFTPDGTKAYVVIQDSNAVGVIDTTSRMVTNIITGFNSPTGINILADGTKAYVTNFGVSNSGTTVSVIDIGTETIVDTVPVGQGPNGITSTLNSAKVYVANPFSNSVSVIETNNDTVINTLPINTPNFVVVNPDSTKAYVSSNPPIAIDTDTDSITIVNHPGSGPFAFTPDGNKMYTTGGVSEVSVIDVVNDTLITMVTVGTSPRNVAITPAVVE